MRADTSGGIGVAERQGTWVPVCRVDQLRVDLGVAALVGGEQVALFRLDDAEIRAIGNLDPYSRANVLARGIVGSRGESVFVASPMYKQPFDLRTGRCLDDPEVSVPTFAVCVVDGVVKVLAPTSKATSATSATSNPAAPTSATASAVTGSAVTGSAVTGSAVTGSAVTAKTEAPDG